MCAIIYNHAGYVARCGKVHVVLFCIQTEQLPMNNLSMFKWL